MTITSDIAAALRQAAIATGGAVLTATLTKPGVNIGPSWAPEPGPTTPYTVAVINSDIRVKDGSGALTGQVMRSVLMEAGVVAPAKGDALTLRGVEYGIAEVQTTAPGGVDLMYRLILHR